MFLLYIFKIIPSYEELFECDWGHNLFKFISCYYSKLCEGPVEVVKKKKKKSSHGVSLFQGQYEIEKFLTILSVYMKSAEYFLTRFSIFNMYCLLSMQIHSEPHLYLVNICWIATIFQISLLVLLQLFPYFILSIVLAPWTRFFCCCLTLSICFIMLLRDNWGSERGKSEAA